MRVSRATRYTADGARGTPEAGTRGQCVRPWEQAALRLRYVHNAGGWSASPVRAVRRPRGARVSLCRDRRVARPCVREALLKVLLDRLCGCMRGVSSRIGWRGPAPRYCRRTLLIEGQLRLTRAALCTLAGWARVICWGRRTLNVGGRLVDGREDGAGVRVGVDALVDDPPASVEWRRSPVGQ